MQEVNKVSPKVFGRVFTDLRIIYAVFLIALFGFASPVRSDDLMDNFKEFQMSAQTLVEAAAEATTMASAHPFAPPEAFDMAGGFARGIINFSDLAKALSAQLELNNGPRDLRCIYRGMAEDAKKRLSALQHAKNAGAQAVILKDLNALFSDAVEITPASKTALADHHEEGAGQCPTAPGQKIDNLPNL